MKSDRRYGLLAHVPPGWYGVSEVAAKTGIPVATLRRWRKSGVLVPSGRMKGGDANLYSDQDIEAAVAYRNRPRPKPNTTEGARHA